MTTREVRRRDYALSDEQQQIVEVFTALFERECPTGRVRDAEPVGFDAALWKMLTETGVVSMGLSASAGGDDATLVDLALVAEACGRALAPVPLIDAVVATRLIATVAPPDILDELATGAKTATVALHPAAPGDDQLVSSGAVADVVVALVDGELVLYEEPPPGAVSNLGSAPLAWRMLSGPAEHRTVLARGQAARMRFEHAILEWKTLMAAAQTGVAAGALALALDYAKEREAFGVQIGAFQAISHPLVDVATGVEGSVRLHRRAAWWLDHEPEKALDQVLMAFIYAGEVALRAATTGIHVQGGFGFTLESDMQLYFRRARGWTLVAGDPNKELQRLGDHLYGNDVGH